MTNTEKRTMKIKERGAVKAIAEHFGCSSATVTNALKGWHHSVQNSAIVRYAIEHYTVVYIRNGEEFPTSALCLGCKYHIATPYGDYCTRKCIYQRSQILRCKNKVNKNE